MTQVRQQTAKVAAQNEALSAKVNTLTPITAAHAAVASRLATLRTAEAGDIAWSQLLARISATMPAGATLTNISFTSTAGGAAAGSTGSVSSTGSTGSSAPVAGSLGSVSMSVTANGDEDQVATWLRALDQVKGISAVFVPSGAASAGTVTFSSTASVTEEAPMVERNDGLRGAVMSRRIPLLVALGLVVVLAGWYVALWSPQHSALKAARAKGVTELATQTQLSSELGQLRALQRGLPAETAALRRSLPALPQAVSFGAIIDQIDGVAKSSGVQWTNESQSASGTASSSATTTSATTSGAGVSGASVVSMGLTVSGPYQATTSFISAIGLLPRLFVIDSLQYSPSASTVTATITGRAFYDPTPLPVIPGRRS